MIHIKHECIGHRWMLLSEEQILGGIKRIFKCPECLYEYEQKIFTNKKTQGVVSKQPNYENKKNK